VEMTRARNNPASPAARPGAGPALAGGALSAWVWGMAASGASVSPGITVLPRFAGDALSLDVSADPALMATISRGVRSVTSTSFAGATDAADICMNSKYPPTVTTEAPAIAITPEASL